MFANSKSSVRLNKTQEYFRLVWGQKESRLFMLLVIMIAIMAILRPDTFFTSQNMFNILRQISLITIVAVAQTFIIISGGIDLSVGFSGTVRDNNILSVGCRRKFGCIHTCRISASVAIGLVNGLIITMVKLPPFIVTIGMSYIARGLAFVITKALQSG